MTTPTEIKAEIQRRIKLLRAGRKAQDYRIRQDSKSQQNALNDLMSWIDVRESRSG